MINNILLSWLIIFSFAISVNAKEVQPKSMDTLSCRLSNIQLGFLTNNKKMIQDSLAKFKEEVNSIIGSEEAIRKLLPQKAKHKSSIALNTAKMIKKHILEIEKVLTEKNMRMINRQKRSQRSFLEIQNQCFRCHNLVKDLG